MFFDVMTAHTLWDIVCTKDIVEDSVAEDSVEVVVEDSVEVVGLIQFNSYVYVTGFGFIDPPRFAVSFRVSTPSRRILQPGAYKGRVCVIFIVLISVGARMTNGTVPTSAGLLYAIPVFVPSSNVDKDFAGGPPRSGTIPETTNKLHLRPNKLHFVDVEAD